MIPLGNDEYKFLGYTSELPWWKQNGTSYEAHAANLRQIRTNKSIVNAMAQWTQGLSSFSFLSVSTKNQRFRVDVWFQRFDLVRLGRFCLVDFVS